MAKILELKKDRAFIWITNIESEWCGCVLKKIFLEGIETLRIEAISN